MIHLTWIGSRTESWTSFVSTLASRFSSSSSGGRPCRISSAISAFIPMYLPFLWPSQALRPMTRVSTSVAAMSGRSFSFTRSRNQEKDYYVTLSLPRNATKGQVKRRFYEVCIVCFSSTVMTALIQTFPDYLVVVFLVTPFAQTRFPVVQTPPSRCQSR